MEALLRQQTEQRVIFDLTPAMICVKDTKNGILRVNQRLAEYAGKSVEEIEGKSYLEIFPHEAAKFYESDLEVIHSGAPILGVVEMVHGPEGQEYWVQTDKVPLCDKEGTVVGIVVMVQDITERRKSLGALEDATNRLQLATEVTGTGVWDWDLRTDRIVWDKQMFALYGLERRDVNYDTWAAAVLPEDLAEQAAILKETVRRGGRSERQFRIRRLSDGAVRTIYSSEMAVKDDAGVPLRVVGVNRDITEQLRTEQELKEAKVVAALREGTERYSFLADTMPQIVWTARPDGCVDYYNQRWLDYTALSLEQSKDWGWDSMRLRQILLNFADNAVKFTKHGSVVVQVTAEAQRTGEQCLHFSIKDTGIGIPPEKQELIFEAFAQVDGSTTRTHGGTGLGLAIASQLIEKMRGKIWIESTPGWAPHSILPPGSAWQRLFPRSLSLCRIPMLRRPFVSCSRRIMRLTALLRPGS